MEYGRQADQIRLLPDLARGHGRVVGVVAPENVRHGEVPEPRQGR